jgi:hypothetical protein
LVFAWRQQAFIVIGCAVAYRRDLTTLQRAS